MMKSKKILLTAVIAAVVLGAVVASLFFIFGDRTVDAVDTLPLDTLLTAEQAEEDLAFMYEAVKENHPCYLDGSGIDADFDSAYEEARKKLTSAENITVAKLWEIGAEMYCSLQDGHTLITCYNSKQLLEQERLSAGSFVSVDGIPREELLSRFKAVFPCEPTVEFYVDFMLDEALKYESWSILLGIDTADGITAEIQTENGIETVEFTFGYPDLTNAADAAENEESFFSYEFYEDKSAAVFKLDECIVTDGYKNALEEFFRQVREKNISRVAVDLRENGGGNSMVINEFMKYIDVESYYVFGGSVVRSGSRLIENKPNPEKNKKSKYAFSGELYALTSNYTFSSAMNFAVTISDNKIGRIIGEIPGNKPSHYGDKLTFQTPNAKLLCSTSFKKFYRADRSKDDIPLIPDIEVEAENALDTFLNLN